MAVSIGEHESGHRVGGAIERLREQRIKTIRTDVRRRLGVPEDPPDRRIVVYIQSRDRHKRFNLDGCTMATVLAELERVMIVDAIERTPTQTAAAQLLDMTRETFRRRAKALGVEL
jgi:DNA-binding NtrC family response regulator